MRKAQRVNYMNNVSFYVTTKTEVDDSLVIYKNTAPDTAGIDALLGMRDELNDTTVISLSAKVNGKPVYLSGNNTYKNINKLYEEAELSVEKALK